MMGMGHIISSWPPALRFLFKDPINLVLLLIPAGIAILFYALTGGFIISQGMGWSEALIAKYVISKEAGLILYYVFTGLLIFLFFLLVNWTFILCLAIVASPFNDMISARIDQKMRGTLLAKETKLAFSTIRGKIWRTLLNELKKNLIILFFTLLALGLSFFPLLYPLTLALIALLMTSQFLDYSWSRHHWGVRQCLQDLMRHLPANLISGLMFLVLVAVPFLNTLVPALATSYYTVLWNKRQMSPAIE